MRLWHVARGVAWRSIRNVLKTPALLLPTILFPLFFFTAFAGGLSQVENVPGFDYPGDYTSFQFVFVLLQSAAFGGVFTGFGIARDFESGFGKRLMLASPNRVGILFGYAIAALVRWTITATVLTTVALLVGMQVGGNAAEIVGLYSLALLVNTAALLWAAGIAMRFRTIQMGPVMQLPVFLLLFFAPVYVPLDLLTGGSRRSRRSTRSRTSSRRGGASSRGRRPKSRSRSSSPLHDRCCRRCGPSAGSAGEEAG